MDNSNNYVHDMNEMFQPLLLNHRNELSFEYTYYYDQIDSSQIEIQYVEYEIPDVSDELSEDSMPELETLHPPTPSPSPTSIFRPNEIMNQNDIEIQIDDNGTGFFTENLMNMNMNMNIRTPSITRGQYRNSFWTNIHAPTHSFRDLSNEMNIYNGIDFRSRLISSFSSQQEEDQLSNVLNESLYQDTNRYKYVISENGKKDLKHKTFFLDDFKEQTSCPITQDDFEEGQLIIELPCHHIFEPESIMKWLDTHSHKCPVCRYELDSKEIEDTQENEISTLQTENDDIIEQMVEYLISTEMMNNDSIQQVLWESILGEE